MQYHIIYLLCYSFQTGSRIKAQLLPNFLPYRIPGAGNVIIIPCIKINAI